MDEKSNSNKGSTTSFLFGFGGNKKKGKKELTMIEKLEKSEVIPLTSISDYLLSNFAYSPHELAGVYSPQQTFVILDQQARKG